jgi:hypothetical protein
LLIEAFVPPDKPATATEKVFWFFSSEKNTFASPGSPGRWQNGRTGYRPPVRKRFFLKKEAKTFATGAAQG